MRKLKIYGVNGLLEWTAAISVGKAVMKVHFAGGALTEYGVTPAEYSTESRAVQLLIENSAEFKSGKISLLNEIEMEEEAGSVASPAHRLTGSAQCCDVGAGGIDGGGLFSEERSVVKVKTLVDAQNFLKSEFKVSSAKVTTVEKAKKIAQERGVELVIESE